MTSEEDALRAFHEEIETAWRKSREQSRHPFFAGQRLRRLVREALERYEAQRGYGEV